MNIYYYFVACLGALTVLSCFVTWCAFLSYRHNVNMGKLTTQQMVDKIIEIYQQECNAPGKIEVTTKSDLRHNNFPGHHFRVKIEAMTTKGEKEQFAGSDFVEIANQTEKSAAIIAINWAIRVNTKCGFRESKITPMHSIGHKEKYID